MSTSFASIRRRSQDLAALALAVGLGILVLAGCGRKASLPMVPPPPDVIVDTVQKKEVQLYIRTTGHAAPYEEVNIVARVPGYLEEILFEPGKIVQKNDALFLIEQESYRIALDAAEAELKVCEANEALAKANLKRAEELVKTKAINVEEFETKISNYKTALANIERAKTAIEQAKLNLGYTDIRAPISGKTDKKYVDVGNYVGQGGAPTHLVTVTRMDPLLIDFDISDSQFNMYNRKKNFVQELKLGRSRPGTGETSAELPKPVFTQVAAKVALEDPASAEANTGEEAVQSAEEGTRAENTEPPVAPTTAEVKFPFDVDYLSTSEKSDNYTHHGEMVAIINNEIGATVGQITLRGQVPNPNMDIFPGQICRVRIPVEKIPDAVLVREEAIMTDLDMKYVVLVVDGETEVLDMEEVKTGKKVKSKEGGETVDEIVKMPKFGPDGKPLMKKVRAKIAKRAAVKLGPLVENGMYVVTEGLTGGETYIVLGTQKARFDQPVNVVDN